MGRPPMLGSRRGGFPERVRPPRHPRARCDHPGLDVIVDPGDGRAPYAVLRQAVRRRPPVATEERATTVSTDAPRAPAALRWASLAGKRSSAGRWSGRRASNPLPQPWQGCALPIELLPLDGANLTSGVPASPQQGGQPPPLLPGQGGSTAGRRHLDADVVGARLQVAVDPPGDGLQVPPGHHLVHQPVAAVVLQVAGREAQPQPVVGVVRRLEVHGQVLPGHGPGPGRVGLQDHGLLGCQEPPGTEQLPGAPGVLHRDQVGMGPGGAVPGQLQHPRPQGGQRPLLPGHRLREPVQAVQVLPHPGQRPRVAAGLVAVDHVGVAHPQAQEEAPGVGPGDLVVGPGHVLGGVRPDAGDAGGGHQPPGGAQNLRGQLEDPGTVGEPERPVSQLLQLGGHLADLVLVPAERPAPDADPTQVHSTSSTCRTLSRRSVSLRARHLLPVGGPRSSRPPGTRTRSPGDGRPDGARRPGRWFAAGRPSAAGREPQRGRGHRLADHGPARAAVPVLGDEGFGDAPVDLVVPDRPDQDGEGLPADHQRHPPGGPRPPVPGAALGPVGADVWLVVHDHDPDGQVDGRAVATPGPDLDLPFLRQTLEQTPVEASHVPRLPEAAGRVASAVVRRAGPRAAMVGVRRDRVRTETTGLDGERLERIGDHLVERYVRPGEIAGCQVLVARRGRTAYFRCFGLADLERRQPVREDTIWRIYSMTKPITSVALMTLYERGCFQLTDPVHRFLPEWKEVRVCVTEGGRSQLVEPERPVTVRDLLTHTDGLSYGMEPEHPVDRLYAEAGLRDPSMTLEELSRRLASLPLAFQPGSRWRYSFATDVCGRLVEVLADRPFGQYLRETIFEPLGMVDTGFVVPAGAGSRFAANYQRRPEGGLQLLDDPARSPYLTARPLESGGGGLVSTTPDYLRFCEMLRRGGELEGARVLGPRTVAFMARNHLPGGAPLSRIALGAFCETRFPGVGFGLGLAVLLDPVEAGGVGSPGEVFWGGAASTLFWVDPAEDLVVIFMAQLMPSGTFDFRGQLRQLVHQAIVG